MDELDNKFLDQYRRESREMIHRRLLAILWIGITMIPLFSILDYVAVRDFAWRFFIYRISCAMVFLILLFFYYRDFGRRHPYVIAVLAYVIAGSTISIMCVNMGGYSSPYYAGMLMVLITFSTILPLNSIQAVRAGVGILLIYCVPIFIFSTPTDEGVRIFFMNMFFFTFLTAITVVKCYVHTRERRHEFNLRMERNTLSERLSYYAKNLEDEVEKRARALEESELRYKELFDNIIDIVILVNASNHIQMANPRFYECVGISSPGSSVVHFMGIVHPDDSQMVGEQLIPRLLTENDINDFQFRILTHQGVTLDVECNAHVIKKDGNFIGCQMVIRDITVRKRLEQDLIESYKHAQNARAAAIIGLAKLAEYRDEDTGNHLERIREYARIIAMELALKSEYRGYITPEYIDDIYSSSILHDIGKVGIPDSILLKPGRLTDEEFEIIKRHPILGGDAIKAVESKVEGISFLTLGKEIAYFHHEKWDGSGYAKGLKGKEIPLSARIVALADVYDALTSKRTYKEAFSHEKAMEIIISERERHFAPDIVDAFIIHEQRFRCIREELHGALECLYAKGGDPL